LGQQEQHFQEGQQIQSELQQAHAEVPKSQLMTSWANKTYVG
jgi:hypothetical protein